MSKTYKGYELIKEIAEGNIKDGTRFEDEHGNVYIKTKYVDYLDDEKGYPILDTYSLEGLAVATFKQIEEKEDEIDIQDIKEFGSVYTMNTVETLIKNKLNEVIKGMKQLDNKINK